MLGQVTKRWVYEPDTPGNIVDKLTGRKWSADPQRRWLPILTELEKLRSQATQSVAKTVDEVRDEGIMRIATTRAHICQVRAGLQEPATASVSEALVWPNQARDLFEDYDAYLAEKAARSQMLETLRTDVTTRLEQLREQRRAAGLETSQEREEREKREKRIPLWMFGVAGLLGMIGVVRLALR